MSIVSYNICCCDCTKINGMTAMIIVNGSVDKYLNMSEYEFSNTLNDWMEDLDSNCHFCGSKNVYGENIKINEVTLYDFESIVERLKTSSEIQNFLIINLIKSQGFVEREIGGKSKNDSNFMLESKSVVLRVIDAIAPQRFVKSEFEGHFFIAITGTSQNIRIERLKMCGFDKSELKKVATEYFIHYNF